MKDNFDLKKFLKESKAIENLNPSLKAINEKEDKSLKENSLKSKIREMIIDELSEADGTADITLNRGGGASQPNNEYDFLSESDDLHEKDESGLADAAIKDIKKKGKDSEWIKNLPKGMADKLLKKIKDEKSLKEAEKDEDGEEMEDESREERADVDKYEFEKGKEAGEEEGKSGIEDIAADLDGTESDLMGNLMNALKIAKGMDNEKLEFQIGNTLKFFVSTYIDKEENER